MQNSNIKILFKKSEFNSKCNNLLNEGFEEYLTTLEDGITHSIFVNTDPKSPFNSWVVDIWDNGELSYSRQ